MSGFDWFGYQAGTDAPGADLDSFRLAIDNSSYYLQIGMKRPAGLIMRMADIVAHQCGFATEFAAI